MHETQGSDAVAELAKALVHSGHQVPRILDALTMSLTTSLCDRCSIELSVRTGAEPVVATRVIKPREAILPVSATALLVGSVTVVRDDESPAFEAREIADIETCITFAMFAADVVIRLEAERAALRTANERAEQFHRTMLSVVGHDMHSPLSAIRLGAEMLVANHRDDRSLGDVVNRIVSFANRMTGMVDQLLDLSRAQLGGGIPLARTELRLAPVIESVIEELELRYPRNQFSLSGDAALKGAWDADRLRQVVASLVTNAVRHGIENGPVAVAMSQAGGCTQFAVHNDCDGPIAPEELADLFEPYRRGDEERSRTGLGVGLYIAREIVEAHGGRVDVESTATGTTFRVVLPNYL